MFVHYTKELKKPIKIWLEDRNAIDENCLEQAEHLAQLPFIHKWVCLMPDTHAGKGMPIGGVIATKGVIIPNWKRFYCSEYYQWIYEKYSCCNCKT